MEQSYYRGYLPQYLRLAQPAEYHDRHRPGHHGRGRHPQPRDLPDHPGARTHPHGGYHESYRSAQSFDPGDLSLSWFLYRPDRHAVRQWRGPADLLAATALWLYYSARGRLFHFQGRGEAAMVASCPGQCRHLHRLFPRPDDPDPHHPEDKAGGGHTVSLRRN